MRKSARPSATAEIRPAHVPERKLFAPLHVQRVERRFILQRVFCEQAPAVVVLQAPAGHGKSVALEQIKEACEQRGIVCAWLNLDETDNDSRRHANHLRALLSQVGASRLRSARAAKTPGKILGKARSFPQKADWLIDALTRVEREVALFIDEFEVLTDRSVLTFWRDFLLRTSPSVRVFIASRASPEVGLARLQVSNRLLLLSADDLRFSREEVHAFFDQHRDMALHPAEVEAIWRRSEGWPAAVQLFRLGLSNAETRQALSNLDHARPRELAEYLTECVLDGLPSTVRDFLLQTSVLTRLQAGLCDELTGRQDAQSILIRLEREGLFMRALDSDRQWFRYHPLFASLLAEQLASIDSASVPVLHGRAACWWRSQGQFEEAMHHAVAARDFPLACSVLREWSSRLVANGEMATISRWLDHIPPEFIDNDAPLTIRVVWALTFLHHPAKLARHLDVLDRLRMDLHDSFTAEEAATVRAIATMCADRIEEAQSIIGPLSARHGLVEGFDAFEQAAGENLRAYLRIFRGDFAAAHGHLVRARSFSQLGDATFTHGYTACFEGALLVLEGRLHAALECLRSGLEQQRSVLDSGFATAALASCYLWALYEVDDLDLLEAVAEEYRDVLPETAVPDFFAVGQICLARAHVWRDRFDDALFVLEQAQYLATRNRWPRVAAMLELEKKAAALRTLDPERSRAHRYRPGDKERDLMAQALPPAGWTSPAAELQGSTRFLLLGGVRSPATTERPQDSNAEAIPYRQLGMQVEHALRHGAAGKQTAALRTARQALGSAARMGLSGPLRDQGAAVAALLQTLLGADPALASTAPGRLAQRVIGRFRKGGAPAGSDATVPVLRYSSFTAREREILGLLSRRMSNKEMARRALLSENTVKFHLKNVFAKLGVASRLEAYAAIVRLNLASSANP